MGRLEAERKRGKKSLGHSFLPGWSFSTRTKAAQACGSVAKKIRLTCSARHKTPSLGCRRRAALFCKRSAARDRIALTTNAHCSSNLLVNRTDPRRPLPDPVAG